MMNDDGSAMTHVTVQCTLRDISQATGIRIEDVAFAMNECGLLQRRKKRTDKDKAIQNGDKDSLPEEVIVISREMIEKVATERKIKPVRYLDTRYVKLDED